MNQSILDNLITKPYISPSEFGSIFDLSIPTVYRLIAKRIIPVIKIGNSLRFSREDIIEYVDKARIGNK